MKSINQQLLEAAKSGDAEAIKHGLGEAGCDPLVKGNAGWSVLMWAAVSGHADCVGLLMPRSDPLARSVVGSSALMLAAYFGHEDCVKLLLPVSDPLAKDSDDLTASQIARDRGHHAVADMINAYVLALSESNLLAEHVSSGPNQGQARRKSAPRI